MSEPFRMFTSLRYDPLLLGSRANAQFSVDQAPSPFYLLSHHRDRMLSAASRFNMTATTLTLSKLHETCLAAVHATNTPTVGLRVRALLSPSGELTAEAAPTPQFTSLDRFFPTHLPTDGDVEWVVVLDTEPTEVSDFTGFKTTCREMYDEARARSGIGSFAETKEVLLWNGRGEVTEGSLTTIYFWRGGGWVTPELGCGGQAGTVRRYLLEEGLVGEGVVVKGEVVVGEVVLLSNGVRGVWAARVV